MEESAEELIAGSEVERFGGRGFGSIGGLEAAIAELKRLWKTFGGLAEDSRVGGRGDKTTGSTSPSMPSVPALKSYCSSLHGEEGREGGASTGDESVEG
eukprot:2288985-Pleurochrysis_carterae.AAC.1